MKDYKSFLSKTAESVDDVKEWFTVQSADGSMEIEMGFKQEVPFSIFSSYISLQRKLKDVEKIKNEDKRMTKQGELICEVMEASKSILSYVVDKDFDPVFTDENIEQLSMSELESWIKIIQQKRSEVSKETSKK